MYHVDFYLWVVELIKSGFPTTPKTCEISILYPACFQSNTKRIASQQKNKKRKWNSCVSNVCRTVPNQALPAYPKHVARSLCSTAIGVTKRRRCLAWLRPVEEVEISQGYFFVTTTKQKPGVHEISQEVYIYIN